MDATITGFIVQDGIATGAVYVLVAVAMVMVFQVTRVIFVPQGELLSIAALSLNSYVDGKAPGIVWIIPALGLVAFAMDGVRAWRDRTPAGLGWSALTFLVPPVALAIASLLAVRVNAPLAVLMVLAGAIPVALGPIIHRIAFLPLADASPLTLLISAISVHYVLLGLGLYCFGAEGVRTPGLTGTAAMLGEIPIGEQFILTLVVCVVMNIALFLFGATIYGKSLRATAVNHRGARLVGISPRFAGQLTITIAALQASLAAFLVAPTATLYYDSGFLLGLKGFVGAIVGGLVSYPAAAAGSLMVGLLESFASFAVSTFKDVLVFALIIPFLLWRSRAHAAASDDDDA